MQISCKCSRFTWVAILVLVGCAGEPVIPVSDLTSPRGQYSVRMVRPGDTLYMIAWEAGLDYRVLANWNNLIAPYQIESGMRIRLGEPNKKIVAGSKKLQTELPALTTKGSTVGTVTTEVVSNASNPEIKNSKLEPKHIVSNWLWPTSGHIIQHFTGKNGNNGLDISGQKGTRIRATADGVVVYAGTGLRGYGQLLIIQHNDVFLSAYAHNQALLVNEGAIVNGGQTVAEMGDTDAESPRLHFEIRRDGRPVNPLDYLPPQS